MTQIRYKLKPVWHETAAVCLGRCVLVAESPVNLLIRLKGTRVVLKPRSSAIDQGTATVEANTQRLQRIKERGARRKSKGGVR